MSGVLSPVHTSNDVEATFEFVEATFDFVDATFDFFERIVRLVAFDNVASALCFNIVAGVDGTLHGA